MEFPTEWFEDEERWGFMIPSMMKRAWAAELEVLEVVRTLCKEHDIPWYATGGTLLGAIRHKGFIPWDDDIDIYMLRDDYDRFLEAAADELPKGFVLSGIYGKNERLWAANDMQQARVIADEEYFNLPRFMTYFHGFPYMRVGIDIFPYTFLPKEKNEQYRLFKVYYALNFTAANLALYRKDNILKKRLKELEKYVDAKFPDTDNDIVLAHALRYAADKWISAVKREEADAAVNAMYITVPDDQRDFGGIKGRPIEWHKSVVELPFETTTMCVPVEYEKAVIDSVGPDYMTPVMFSGDHEYPFYKKQEAALRQLLDESGVSVSTDEFCKNWHMMNGGH